MIRVRLKEILDNKGITITELHELTGISKNTISLMVNDKSKGIQYDTLAKIIKATNTKLEDMLEVVSDFYAMYVTEVDNDYSPLDNHEHRKFRYKIWVDLESGDKELVYDLTFSVLYFKVNEVNDTREKSFFHISFYDYHSKDTNHELAVKFNPNMNKTVINVISYLVVTDILFNMNMPRKNVPTLSYFNWVGFERDNVHQTSINVPISPCDFEHIKIGNFGKGELDVKMIANFRYLQHCFSDVESFQFDKDTGEATVFFHFS